MRIILDSNVYVADLRMEGIAFSNLFDFIRKTKSTLVVPRIVREEVVHTYTQRLTAQVRDTARAWKAFRYLMLDNDPGEFYKPELKYQLRELRKRLRRPAKDVTVVYCQDVFGVDINDVALRGIKRIPPASAEGEELRDVIIWFQVMALAKASAGEPTAFITGDTGFWDGDLPRSQIQQDIVATNLEIYKSVDEFIKANSPRHIKLTAETAERLIPATLFRDLVISKLSASIKRSANSFLMYEIFSTYAGHVEMLEVKPLTSTLLDRTVYEINPDVSFVTATYEYQGKAVLKLGAPRMWNPPPVGGFLGAAVQPFTFASGGLAQPNPFLVNATWYPTQEDPGAANDPDRIQEVLVIGRASASTRVVAGSIEEKGLENFVITSIEAGETKLDVAEVVGPRGETWLRATRRDLPPK